MFLGRRGAEDAEMSMMKTTDAMNVMGMLIGEQFNPIEFLCVLCASAANK